MTGISRLYDLSIVAQPDYSKPNRDAVVPEALQSTKIAPSEALQKHLARHDLPAEVQRITADTANIFNVILSLVADKSTDLIVMGGYGTQSFGIPLGRGYARHI